MAKPNLQKLLNETKSPGPTKGDENQKSVSGSLSEPPKRSTRKPGEVNISAYFPPEVKASLRMVQAKTGNNVKQCLAEALTDYFRKHNVPVTIPME